MQIICDFFYIIIFMQHFVTHLHFLIIHISLYKNTDSYFCRHHYS